MSRAEALTGPCLYLVLTKNVKKAPSILVKYIDIVGSIMKGLKAIKRI
ncbi:hypothetical protein TASCI_40240 [Tenacibaculum ascidiaceicola]